MLTGTGAIQDHSDLFECDETSSDHLIELRKNTLNSFRRVLPPFTTRERENASSALVMIKRPGKSNALPKSKALKQVLRLE